MWSYWTFLGRKCSLYGFTIKLHEWETIWLIWTIRWCILTHRFMWPPEMSNVHQIAWECIRRFKNSSQFQSPYLRILGSPCGGPLKLFLSWKGSIFLTAKLMFPLEIWWQCNICSQGFTCRDLCLCTTTMKSCLATKRSESLNIQFTCNRFQCA